MNLSRILSKLKRQNRELSVLQKFQQYAKQCYQQNPKFYEQFISIMVTESQIQWLISMHKSIGSSQLYYKLMLGNQQSCSLLILLVNIWVKYWLHERIKQPYTDNTLGMQLKQLNCVMAYLLLITSSQDSNELTELLLDLMRIYITSSLQFKPVYLWFVTQKCNIPKVIHFTNSQIQQNVKQLQSTIMIKHIPAPFHQTISLIRMFHQEFIPSYKVKLATQIYQQVKIDIQEYRKFYQLKPKAIGMDHILPSLSLAIERALVNVYPSILLIKSVYGYYNKTFNQEYFCKELNKIDKNIYHSLKMLQIASSVNSHSSQIFK